MATWTELLSGPDGMDRQVEVGAVEFRDLLLDLPNHPNICNVLGVRLRTAAMRDVTLLLRGAERMSSGASGLITPGAGVQRDTVQPWRVTPVLGDAGTAPVPLIIDPPPGTWPALLDGAAWPPKVETKVDKPLIILGDK